MENKPWYRLKDDLLLNKKIKDLNLSIEGTAVEPLVERLYQELDKKGLHFHPPCFLADEWFCPVGVPAIGIPFYLAHPRLRKLENNHMQEVEGGTKTEFMRLIRHETGHAYSYAYNLYKKWKWRKLFGSASEEYPDTYRPRPYSKSFVLHLDNWYAQSHPDEDFAETFAVWLTPSNSWKRRYKGWKALEKLNYINDLMSSLSGKDTKNNPIFNPQEHNGLGVKLKTYYKKKTKLFEEDYPDFYDKDLKILFTDNPEDKSNVKASQYLKKAKARLLPSVSFWAKEKKYVIDQLISDLVSRTQELNLYIRRDMADIDIQVSSYITTLVTYYLFTGKFKRSK